MIVRSRQQENENTLSAISLAELKGLNAELLQINEQVIGARGAARKELKKRARYLEETIRAKKQLLHNSNPNTESAQIMAEPRDVADAHDNNWTVTLDEAERVSEKGPPRPRWKDERRTDADDALDRKPQKTAEIAGRVDQELDNSIGEKEKRASVAKKNARKGVTEGLKDLTPVGWEILQQLAEKVFYLVANIDGESAHMTRASLLSAHNSGEDGIENEAG